jgi:hypothetical protein
MPNGFRRHEGVLFAWLDVLGVLQALLLPRIDPLRAHSGQIASAIIGRRWIQCPVQPVGDIIAPAIPHHRGNALPMRILMTTPECSGTAILPAFACHRPGGQWRPALNQMKTIDDRFVWTTRETHGSLDGAGGAVPDGWAGSRRE